MLCPHHDIKIVQRSNRQSAVAAAAYQSGERLFSEYDQKQKYYAEKRGIVHTEIMLPPPRPAGVRRPQHLVERRRSRRKTMELPACPKDRTCHTEGNPPVTARRPDPGLLPGVFCFQRHDCRFCHSRQGGRESPCPHPADHPGNGRNREMASQEPEGL